MARNPKELETFDEIGEELQNKINKLKNAQRRSRIWATKYKRYKEEVAYLKRKLNTVTPSHVESKINKDIFDNG